MRRCSDCPRCRLLVWRRSLGCLSTERDIPDYHLGTSIADVKIWVEQMALGLGYEQVTWDELPGA
jgi:hypothetical protein